MSANGRRQFDPVAAAALSAVDASKRSLSAAQQDTGLPQAPMQNQAAQTVTQGIQQVAQVSPFNVFARGGAPSLPGMQGQGGLPGMQGEGFPSPQSLLPGQGAAGANPLQNLQMPQGVPSPQQFAPTPNQSASSGNGGSTKSDSGGNGNGGRKQEQGR